MGSAGVRRVANKVPAVARRSSDGARGTRTPDLLGAIQALSQLSYSPVRAVARRGVERWSVDDTRRGQRPPFRANPTVRLSEIAACDAQPPTRSLR